MIKSQSHHVYEQKPKKTWWSILSLILGEIWRFWLEEWLFLGDFGWIFGIKIYIFLIFDISI
jgi:hypothetical protein